MENRYLFRGKRIDNGEWAYGAVLFHDSDAATIFNQHPADGSLQRFEVNIKTICQCTGLKDKNGNPIWENDIVKFEDCGEEGYEYKEGFDFENKARVEFTEGRWSLTDFMSNNSAVIDGMYNHAEFMDLWGVCEVIGNKFDTPELLE